MGGRGVKGAAVVRIPFKFGSAYFPGLEAAATQKPWAVGTFEAQTQRKEFLLL